jgi:hypothetical protein
VATARSYHVAVEAVGTPDPRARATEVALEVVSRSSIGSEPLRGNPAVVVQCGAEVVFVPATPAFVSGQLVLEILSRSGLGVNPRPDGNNAVTDYFLGEILAQPDPHALASQVAAEIISRSGIGVEPLRGNPAIVGTVWMEVVSFGTPEPGHTCHCEIQPALPPAKYLMRRPRHFV